MKKYIIICLTITLFFTNCKKESNNSTINSSTPNNLLLTENTSLETKLAKVFSVFIANEENRLAFYNAVPKYKYGFGEVLFVSLLSDNRLNANFVRKFNELNRSTYSNESLKKLILDTNPYICLRLPSNFIKTPLPIGFTPIVRDIAAEKIYLSGATVDEDLTIDGLGDGQVLFYVSVCNAQTQKYVDVGLKKVLYEPLQDEYAWMLLPEVMTHISTHCTKVEGNIYIADIIKDLQEPAQFNGPKGPEPTSPLPPPSPPCTRDFRDESNAYFSFRINSIPSLKAYGNNPCEFGITLKGLFSNPSAVNGLSGYIEEFYDYKFVTQWAVPTGSIGGSTVHKFFVHLFQLTDPPTYTSALVNASGYGNYLVFTVTNPGFSTLLDVPMNIPMFAFGNTWVANTWDPSLKGDVLRISMYEADGCTWNYTSNTSQGSTGTETFNASITANFSKTQNLMAPIIGNTNAGTMGTIGYKQDISHTNTTASSYALSTSNNYEIGSILYSYCWTGNIHQVVFGNLITMKLGHD